MMIALDYYKQEYIKASHEEERIRAEERIEEAARLAAEEAQNQTRERERVDQMSNEDFATSLFSTLGKINL
ncbi:hypothetical protein D3C72_1189390 [compost metagenome]